MTSGSHGGGNPYHDLQGRFTSASDRKERPESGQKRAGKSKGKPLTDEEVNQSASHALGQYLDEIARGMSPADAAAWAANSEQESRGNPANHQQGGGPGRGLFQWGANKAALDRRIPFKTQEHVDVDKASASQQRDFRDYELNHKFRSTKDMLSAATTAKAKAEIICRNYEAPADHVYEPENRGRIAEAIMRLAARSK